MLKRIKDLGHMIYDKDKCNFYWSKGEVEKNGQKTMSLKYSIFLKKILWRESKV